MYKDYKQATDKNSCEVFIFSNRCIRYNIAYILIEKISNGL